MAFENTGSQNREGTGEKTLGPVWFKTTAAAQDITVVLGKMSRDVRVVSAEVAFTEIDTFASGVDIDLETDDGTTETTIATYDTVSGTAVDTIYRMVPAASQVVDAGEWLQVHINDDEDAAIGGTVFVKYVEI